MKHLIIALVSSLTLLACGGGGGDAAPIPTVSEAVLKPVCSIEFNGDSILAGHALAITPIARLQMRYPDWQLVDKAIVGLTLNSLYNGYQTVWKDGPVPSIGAQLPFAQIKRTSKIVVVELAGNDAYELATEAQFEHQLRDTVTQIQNEGRIPVLTGIVKLVVVGTFTQEVVDKAHVFNSIIHKVASDTKALHAGWDEVPFAGLTDTIDGLHRTQEASDRLTDQLALTLEKVCASL